ncbi:MAG: hypothetical protein JXA30_09590 [Deltaproteobacteria bacterium]|nr:hypothetical protein [Deltaproteobacteria bacterium]
MATKSLYSRLFYSFVFSAALLRALQAQAAPVTEQEALDIAEFWHAAEVNHYYEMGWKRGDNNKDVLLYETPIRGVRYLVGRDAVVDKVKKKRSVLAYIVRFDKATRMEVAYG